MLERIIYFFFFFFFLSHAPRRESIYIESIQLLPSNCVVPPWIETGRYVHLSSLDQYPGILSQRYVIVAAAHGKNRMTPFVEGRKKKKKLTKRFLFPRIKFCLSHTWSWSDGECECPSLIFLSQKNFDGPRTTNASVANRRRKKKKRRSYRWLNFSRDNAPIRKIYHWK